MSAQPSTAFILIPASFSTPAEYDKMIGILENKGQSFKTVGLATVNDGSRMPPASFEDDVSRIRAAVLDSLDTDKHNVVLVTHSYSGIPGSSALHGLSMQDRQSSGHNTAVIGFVTIASFLPTLNESLRDIMRENMPAEYLTGCPGEYFPPTAAEFAPFIFNDLPDATEVAKYHGQMQRHASDSYSGRATYEAWKDIETVQIIPGKDVIVPVSVQEDMYQRCVEMGGKIRKVVIEDGGHCVNVSQPDVVVQELLKVAEI